MLLLLLGLTKLSPSDLRTLSLLLPTEGPFFRSCALRVSISSMSVLKNMGLVRQEDDGDDERAEEQSNSAAEATVGRSSSSSRGGDLFDCLSTLLDQIEEAQGSVDQELRDKLGVLYDETTKIPDASASEMSESTIEARLDELAEKMNLIESKISELADDPDVRGILGATAELWMPVITASADERRQEQGRNGSSLLLLCFYHQRRQAEYLPVGHCE